ncbi:MAG: polysaccharide biosynthesis C-terminal domain-containing protein [Flavobacteriales bacterium]|nr:polysaccharide biosynthesis C-terminal domain-containing protein [Flavobacteriales bacterium]
MQKKFITNLALILLLNLLVKPFYILGIDAEVLKRVEETTPGRYGEYFALIGFTFILNIFLDLGVINYNTRNIAQNKQLLQKHFAGIITLRGILSAGYMVIILLSGFILGYSSFQIKLLVILGINQILVAFILYFRSNLSGLLLFKQDSIISVMDRILLIGICSFLLWGRATSQPFQIEWFVYAQTGAYLFTAILAGLLVLRQTGMVKPKFDITFSISILKQSLPYALLILLMMIYYRSDSVMIERMLPNGARESAIYAQGFRFFEALNMIGFLFAGLLLPIFSKMLKAKESIEKIVYLSFKILLSGAIVIGLSCFTFSKEIIEWRYQTSGIELIQSANAFGMLMICFISICTTYIFGTLLTANGSLKSLNYMAFGGVLLNISLNLYLIPTKGAYGAAIASMITQVGTAVIQVILSFKILHLKIEWKSVLQTCCFVSIFACIISFLPDENHYWYWNLGIFILSGIILSLTTGMFSIKNLLQILKER